MALVNAFGALALEATLQSILTELNSKLETGGEVNLSAANLAALENINAVVSGTVAIDASSLAALETIELGATTLSALENTTVEIGATSLAALETINAIVSGTVALDAPTLAALENIVVSGTVELGATTLAALETISVANFPATQAVSGTVDLSAGSLAALETISVANFPATQPVSGTFWQATQPVSGTVTATGPLTDTQLRATAVPVSGTVTATGPLTDTQLRATAVPVSNGHTQPLTDTQLRATAVPVSIAATVNTSLEENTLAVIVTAATGVAATLTIPAPGAGLFHYISNIEIELYATAARTGSATPVIVTSTNLPGTPSWNFPTAQAIGTIDRRSLLQQRPLKSSVANTATTIVAPVATAGLWKISAYYYTGA